MPPLSIEPSSASPFQATVDLVSGERIAGTVTGVDVGPEPVTAPPLDPYTDPGLVETHVLGFTNSKRDAPWDRHTEPGVEIWGLNNLHISTDIPWDRCHRWFDIHPAEVITANTEHTDWLKANQVPVYMFAGAKRIMESDPWGIAGIQEFPVNEVIDLLGTRYFTNSISWMIAYAAYRMQPALIRYKQHAAIRTVAEILGWGPGDLHEAFTTAGFVEGEGPPPQPVIGVHGVDMATDTEYGAQRPSCEYLIGLAAGAGYGIQIARASDLLASAELYGVDDNGKLRAKMMSRRAEYQEQLDAAVGAKNAAIQEQVRRDAEINHLNGAAADATYWLDRWTMPAIDRDTASKPGQLDGGGVGAAT